MKTVRIALTTAILLSLHATSFCMESTSATACSTIIRKNSHDGTRRTTFDNSGGMFGSGIDTLEKLGQPFGKDHVYALGSDEQAPNRWSQVGKKDIKTLSHAQAFLTAVNAKGWNLSVEALKPSLDLIEADRQTKIRNSHNQFEKNNQAAAALLVSLQTRYKIRSEEDMQAIEKLKAFADKAQEIKAQHNKLYADSPIESELTINHSKNLTQKSLPSFVENKLSEKK